MLFTDKTWTLVISQLTEGLNETYKKRLIAGASFYKENILDENHDEKYLKWLSKAVLPIWTYIVHHELLEGMDPELIIHELIGFVQLNGKNVNGNFGYDEVLSSSSRDKEADHMTCCTLDFADYMLELYP